MEVLQLDLADQNSVRGASRRLQAEPRLDALILNAGVMGGPLRYTHDGFEMQMGLNHMGQSRTSGRLLNAADTATWATPILSVAYHAQL